ncbi:photosystem II reaction center protein PsbM [Lactiplantibacillus plantarum]|nr:photosystem II reaction center protein PsbM [Lactiplantibacillus plantarum]
MTALPSTTVSLEVTFAAYLAVLLGTFVPVAFLIILYIQSESRKAGEAAGRGE